MKFILSFLLVVTSMNVFAYGRGEMCDIKIAGNLNPAIAEAFEEAGFTVEIYNPAQGSVIDGWRLEMESGKKTLCTTSISVHKFNYEKKRDTVIYRMAQSKHLCSKGGKKRGLKRAIRKAVKAYSKNQNCHL